MRNITLTQQKRPWLKSVGLTKHLAGKISLMAIMMFYFSGMVLAQPAFYNNNAATGNSAIPLNSTSNKVQFIYGPSIFKTAGSTGTVSPMGAITKVYFRLGSTVSTSASYSNFTISLAQDQGKSTTWSTTAFSTGVKNVYSATTQTLSGASAGGWYGITLKTPYYYDPTLALVFELKVSAGTGNTIYITTTGGNQSRYSSYSSTTGTVTTGLVDFGFDIKTSKNDLTATGIVGMANTCGASSDPIFVQIKNTGVVDIASGQNIPVGSMITGAGSGSFTKFFNRALKVGSSDTLYVGSMNTIAITGNLNIKSWVSYNMDSIQPNDTNLTTKTFLGPSKPKPDFTTTLYCDSIKFNNTTTDVCNRATAYLWDFDNGKTSTLKSPRFTYNSIGTYNVKLIVFHSGGLKDSVTKTVIVYPKPQPNFYANNQCLGAAVDFNNFTSGTAAYRWTFGDATTSTSTSPSKIYTTASTFSVKLVATAPNGCRDSISKNVTVFTKPVAAFTISNACAGSPASINNTTTGGSSYNWDLGDGSAATFFNPSKVYTTPGTYNVVLTVVSTQGCSDKTNRSVTINPLPIANFTVNNNCLGTTFSFTNTSTGNVSNLWSLGDFSSSSAVSPVRKYTTAKTYDVTLTVTAANSCTHSIIKQVTVFPLPTTVNFSSKDACLGTQNDFVNLSKFPAGGGDLLWRFGDGNVSTQDNPSYIYAAPGTYDVHLIATTVNGCKDSAANTISVFDKPKPTFTVSDVCDGKAAEFFNSTTGASLFAWDFGDGSKDKSRNPSHIYPGPNFYKVTLSVTSPNNCKNSIEGSVTIKPNPELVFLANDHCFGTTVNFNNFSVGASTYSWTFGDNDSTTVTQASHTYKAPGTYNLKLRGVSAKGCSVSQSKTIKVFAKPVPDFTAPTVCSGLTTNFNNSSTGATSYAWNFGDGSGSSISSNPTYQYFNAGTYKVILTATSTDNCVEEVAKTVTVSALPIPIFLVQDACAGVSVKPTNASIGNIVSQKWYFGDASTDTSKSPSHIYANPGIYKLQLVLTSDGGCIDSTSKTLLIYTKPIIKVSESVKVSKGKSAQLTAGGGTDYLWTPAESLDNPAVANPMATPGQETRYTVKVMNAFGCSDTASVNVTITEDFSIEPQNLITPNGNTQNDVWKIKGIEFYPTAKVLVFDQWGRIILEEEGYKNTWDGTLDGKPLPDGGYYYIITMPGLDREYKGIINILRN